MNANDLQEWINHLTDTEKELPILISHKMFPNELEKMEPSKIFRYMGHDGTNEFILLCEKEPVQINIECEGRFQHLTETTKQHFIEELNERIKRKREFERNNRLYMESHVGE